ncbi:hypothetical protein DUI87_13655 [Hirundo rustica rustica]|uniref:Uncharacterized protein n=1 Tax=Hirundo rustica rustica TaxID=333673 RepID=A0A3M0K9L3_HIRRU|nr:hypothetical protein DUI87_13655 [Hirundo rustica rustica]
MKLIRVSPECCDKCLSTCLEFRLKIEGCAIRGYDIDFNITQVCTEYHKNQTKITPPVPRKAVITKMPAIPEVEEQITPVVTKIGPYAIKKTGVQKLIVNPKWSLKRVEMGVQDEDDHVTNRDMDKAEVFNAFFACVINTDDGPRESQCPELEDHDCRNDQLLDNPEIAWDLLLQLDPYKSMGPDGIHPRILKELADVITKPLSMIFEWSWKSGEVPDD